MKKDMKKLFDKQINLEWESAYLYLSLAIDMEKLGLNGFANWFRMQVLEEMFHAKKMFDYLLTRDDDAKLFDIKSTVTNAKTPEKAFELTLSHEKIITASINKMVTQSNIDDDHATHQFLQWYVEEQIEEEDTAGTILQRIKFVEGAPAAILALDADFALRTFTEPVAK